MNSLQRDFQKVLNQTESSNNPVDQYNLGQLYEKGLGTCKDKEKAKATAEQAKKDAGDKDLNLKAKIEQFIESLEG